MTCSCFKRKLLGITVTHVLASHIKLTQAQICHQAGQLAQTKAICEKILAAEPNHPDALHLLGLVAYQTNDLKFALELFNQAISINPTNPMFYYNRGKALQDFKQLEEAIKNYDCALAIKPDFAAAYNNRGLALQRLKRFEAALESYDYAIKAKPDNVAAYFNRGLVLQELEQWEAALESYNRVINLKPDFAESYFKRGFLLQKLKRFEAAILNYDYFISLKPNHAEAYINRGNSLKGLRQLEKAIENFNQAIAINPNYAEAYFNRGLVLNELNLIEKALEDFDRTIACDPAHVEAYWSKSLTLLANSLSVLSADDLEKGWELYEWRSKREKIKYQPIPLANKWDGEKMTGSLLVLSEQGLGDKIFYANLLNNLPALVGRITVCVEPRLVSLYQRSFEQIEFIPEISSQNAQTFDAQIYMPSLGRYFRSNLQTFKTITIPYLSAHPEKTRKFRERLIDGKNLICGLSWVSKNAEYGLEKTLRLTDLKPILSLPGIKFVDLQYGNTDEEQKSFFNETGIRLTRIHEVDNSNDIDSLASVIDACDVVLTISNTTAHLAGALGKKVIVLLPYSRGLLWYWHKGTDKSPWYPTATLIRQPKQGDWSSVIEKAKNSLEAEVGNMDKKQDV